MQKLVESFITTANAFDVEGALSLFAADTVIDDVSVGDALSAETVSAITSSGSSSATTPAASCCPSRNWTASNRRSDSISTAISDTRSGS